MIHYEVRHDLLAVVFNGTAGKGNMWHNCAFVIGAPILVYT